MVRAFSRALLKAGRSMAAKIAMIAMTTNPSFAKRSFLFFLKK
jgi:hypothetical protein